MALETARGPGGFRCPRCDNAAHGVLRGSTHKVYQCNGCRHQASLIAGTVLQGTKLALTVWFLAIYLISQAKTGLSALALERQLGVSYPTAWLIHHKLMQAVSQRQHRYVPEGQVQVDDAYLGGERSGGQGRPRLGEQVSFRGSGFAQRRGASFARQAHARSRLTLKAIEQWARENLAPGATVSSDGPACFSAVTAAGCDHQPVVGGGRKPKGMPEFEWINTVPGNLKTSFSGSYHSFAFRKYAARYLAAFAYRYNRRFDLRTLHARLLVAATHGGPHPLRSIRLADGHC